MGGLTSWAGAVCTVAVVCALFEMLAPQGSILKILNFVLGLFLAVAIIVPFANMLNSDNLSFKDIEFNQESFQLPQCSDDLTVAIGKDAVKNIIAKVLDEKAIPYKKIEINMDSSNGTSIDMIMADIYISGKERDKLPEIQKTVKEKTGITPNVFVG